jgi:DNA-binding transcriptional MerR regulator
MSTELTIGRVSKRTGLATKTIRFYEGEGLIPPPRRGENGYRLYRENDVVRLQMVRRARLLGLDLVAIKSLLAKALSADCATFGDELIATLTRQRVEVERRLAELAALHDELAALEEHVRHCCEGCDPAVMAVDCIPCGLIEDMTEGGEKNAVER